MKTVTRTVEHRGAVYRLRKQLEAQQPTSDLLEFVIEGPRGTGKSNGIGYLVWKLCRKHAGARVLVIRTSRTLLTDTFCKTFEEDVCPGDECIGAMQRTNRHEYVFKNGSRIVLGGLDDAKRYYGSDWDLVIPEEAVQFKWKEIEPFLGSLRNNRMGWHAMIYPCNPDAPSNWVNVRANQGLAKRMRCYHKDNPSLWDLDAQEWTPKGKSFMQTLERYTGVQYDRHVLGLWRGAEGVVWETYDPKSHLFVLPDDWRKDLGIIECRMSCDWGFRDTGVLIVWGIDTKKRMRALAWQYRTQKNLNWWAEQAVAFAKEFQVTKIVADPSRQDAIDLFNDLLVRNKLSRICYDADNKRATTPQGDLAGLDLVRWGFEKDDDGKPRVMFNVAGLRGAPDPDLVAEGKPSLGYDEIPEYTYARDALGEVLGDRTDNNCRDDFCDATRYGVSDNWPRTPRAEPEPDIVYAPNTYAGMVGTPESLLRERLRKERMGDDL